MSTTKELRELTLDDLTRRATEAREVLFQDRLKMRTGALDSPAARTQHRKELARILTVLSEKRRAAPQS
jgi:large subunit ribosomal protein L29